MLCNDLHRLAATRRLQHSRIAPDLLENVTHRLSNQRVIINHQYFQFIGLLPYLYNNRLGWHFGAATNH